MCIFAQHTIQTMAPSRRQDFAPVMFAYGCKPVGIEDTAFQKVQSSKKFDSAQREKTLRQICERKIESPKTTLVSHLTIDSYAAVLLLKRAGLFNLTIERPNRAYLMAPRAQRARQRVHDINERARSLQRRSLSTDHQDSYSMLSVRHFLQLLFPDK